MLMRVYYLDVDATAAPAVLGVHFRIFVQEVRRFAHLGRRHFPTVVLLN